MLTYTQVHMWGNPRTISFVSFASVETRTHHPQDTPLAGRTVDKMYLHDFRRSSNLLYLCSCSKKENTSHKYMLSMCSKMVTFSHYLRQRTPPRCSCNTSQISDPDLSLISIEKSTAPPRLTRRDPPFAADRQVQCTRLGRSVHHDERNAMEEYIELCG